MERNKIMVYVDHSSVREYIMEDEIIDGWTNSITNILEYKLDVRLKKLIQGKGLCEYLAKGV